MSIEPLCPADMLERVLEIAHHRMDEMAYPPADRHDEPSVDVASWLVLTKP